MRVSTKNGSVFIMSNESHMNQGNKKLKKRERCSLKPKASLLTNKMNNNIIIKKAAQKSTIKLFYYEWMWEMNRVLLLR